MLHHPQSSDQGFTLVELLVALMLMALMSIILFGGLRFGMRAWETGGQQAERAITIEQVQNLLRRQVGQAKVLLWLPDSVPAAAFAGRPDSIRFVAPLPAHRGVGGTHVFYLFLHEDAGRSDLVLGWQVLRPEHLLSSDFPAPTEQTILLKDIAGIELAYYGRVDPEQPTQWRDHWDGAGSTPQLVRLRVAFPSSDTRRWPDLIIRIMGSTA